MQIHLKGRFAKFLLQKTIYSVIQHNYPRLIYLDCVVQTFQDLDNMILLFLQQTFYIKKSLDTTNSGDVLE